MSNLVFVYGTLLSGMRNHTILRNAEFKGGGVTADRFSLFAHAAYPAITLEKRNHIEGELYEVDEHIMKRLDYLEGYDPENIEPSLYERKLTSVVDRNGNEVQAWVYYQKDKVPRGMRLYETGNYRNIVSGKVK